MESESACTIEISDERVTVELDGVRSVVSGRDAVAGVKRVVAQQLLTAMAQVPQFSAARRERERQELQYGAQAQLSGLVGANGPAYDYNRDAVHLARAIQRNGY